MPRLEETQRILVDYIGLLARKGIAATTRPKRRRPRSDGFSMPANTMKTVAIALIACLGLLARRLRTRSPGVQVKNRAKEVVNQNNVRQGVPPPSQTRRAPHRPAGQSDGDEPGADPRPEHCEDQSRPRRLQDRLDPTAEQKQQFIKDLAVAARSTKPSLPTVTTFVDSLIAGLSEATLTSEQQGRLAQNLEAVLNSKPLPASQFDAIIADVQAILQVGSVKRTAAAGIADDLKAVGTEVRR